MIFKKGGEPAADAQIDPHPGIVSIDPVHIIPLLVCYHLKGQLVVVSQEERPLAGLWYGRGLLNDIDYRKTILPPDRHEQSGHQWKMECYMAQITFAKVCRGIFGPLVRLCQKHSVPVLTIYMSPQSLQERVRLRQILAVGALTHIEVRDSVQPKTVNTHLKPEVNDLEYGFLHIRIAVV